MEEVWLGMSVIDTHFAFNNKGLGYQRPFDEAMPTFKTGSGFPVGFADFRQSAFPFVRWFEFIKKNGSGT